jgi:hypothetical protein
MMTTKTKIVSSYSQEGASLLEGFEFQAIQFKSYTGSSMIA